jgi:HSP20 family molecular chaperone IbpA
MPNALDLWRSNRWMHPLRALSRQNDPFERMLKDIMTVAPADESKFEFSPTCEITEHDKTYQLKFDLPGVKKEHIKVDVDGVLTVTIPKAEMKLEKPTRQIEVK